MVWSWSRCCSRTKISLFLQRLEEEQIEWFNSKSSSWSWKQRIKVIERGKHIQTQIQSTSLGCGTSIVLFRILKDQYTFWFLSVDGYETKCSSSSCVPKKKFPVMTALAASAVVVIGVVLILFFLFRKKMRSSQGIGRDSSINQQTIHYNMSWILFLY